VAPIIVPDHPWAVPPGYRTAPSHFNVVHDVLDRPLAEGRGGEVAVRDGRGTVTFAELTDAAARFAGALRRLGVDRGTTFLLRSLSCRESFVTFLAGVKLGAVPILANSLLGPGELSHVLANGEPELAVVHANAATAVRDVQRHRRFLRHVIVIGGAEPEELDFDVVLKGGVPVPTAHTRRDDPAFLNYTSGTTGEPKGILHAHRWVVANGDFARLHMPLVRGDVVLSTSELSFGWGLGHGFLWPLRNGGSVALLDARPSVERVLAAIGDYGVTALCTVPTMIRSILAIPDAERRFRVDSLRLAYCAGEPLAEPTYREWRRRFPCELYDVYGCSELQVFVANGPGMPVKPGSMGRPHPGLVLRVLDDALNECGPGSLGTLCVRADDPSLFLEYRKQPDKWREAHRGGWYFTGDKVHQDEDGYLWYVGRQDDLFKSRGYLISPKEIEDAVLKHGAAIEAAVVAQLDPEIGNRIKAFVVLREGVTGSDALREELRQTVRGLIAPYKVPQTVEFVAALPKSAVGKILRRTLRDVPAGETG
jgi:acyl-coenzyme A synthetase/AMP-(fatty) acid ligase